MFAACSDLAWAMARPRGWPEAVAAVAAAPVVIVSGRSRRLLPSSFHGGSWHRGSWSSPDACAPRPVVAGDRGLPVGLLPIVPEVSVAPDVIYGVMVVPISATDFVLVLAAKQLLLTMVTGPCRKMSRHHGGGR